MVLEIILVNNTEEKLENNNFKGFAQKLLFLLLKNEAFLWREHNVSCVPSLQEKCLFMYLSTFSRLKTVLLPWQLRAPQQLKLNCIAQKAKDSGCS